MSQAGKCESIRKCLKHDGEQYAVGANGKARCRKCLSASVSMRRVILKLRAIKYKGGSCQMCGYSKCSDAFDFHHLNPENKDFSISQNGKTLGWNKIKKELDKCILLCANCHRETHSKRVNDNELLDKYEQFVDSIKKKNMNCCICNANYLASPFEAKTRKYCSSNCAFLSKRKIKNRPSKEVLESMLWIHPTSKISEMYGVSDTTIGKWAKSYNISKPPRGYWMKN